MNHRVSLLVITSAAFIAGFYGRHDGSNVGVIDLARCWDNYDKVIKLKQVMANKRKGYEDDWRKLGVQLEEAIKEDAGSMQIAILRDDIERTKKRYELELQDFTHKHQKSTYSEISFATESVARDLGLSIIFKGDVMNEEESTTQGEFITIVRTRGIVYYDKRVDITDYVINKLNSDYATEDGKDSSQQEDR